MNERTIVCDNGLMMKVSADLKAEQIKAIKRNGTIDSNAATIDAATLASLDGMSKEELIALIKRVSGAMWGIGIMSDDDAYDTICLKLLHAGLTDDNITRALPALKEWLDRKKGKPLQSVASTTTINTSNTILGLPFDIIERQMLTFIEDHRPKPPFIVEN
jgi:hypothetical protein